MRINGNLVFNTGGGATSGEIQNAYIERLNANPAFAAAEKGRIIFRSDLALYYFNDGAAWVPFATGGNAAALQTEVDNIEATLGTLINADGTANVAAALADPVFGGGVTLTAALNNLAGYVNGNNELSELDDVALVGLANGQFLKYNSTAVKWENDTLQLNDVTDVIVPVAQINLLNGLTSDATDLNKLDGIATSSADLASIAGYAAELVSATEFGYLDGVTSSIQSQLDGLQAGDLGLSSLAAITGPGFVTVNADGNTFIARGLQAPLSGLTISPTDGSATTVFALADDLAAVEALASTGIAVRTGASTWTTRSINGVVGRIDVTNGDGVATNPDIDLATVTDTGTGTFLKLTRDVYGRVTGTEAVVAGDITSLVDTTYVNVSGDSMTGNLTMSIGTSITIPDLPTLDAQAANKAYVDAVAAGLSWKQAVAAATTGALAATNGGSTLTATGNGALVVDGVTLLVGERVLVKDQGTTAQNGIYTVTDAGSAGTPYILTRSTNMDQAGEFLGATVFVLNGTVNDNSGWTQTESVATVGTDPVLWAQFSGSNTYTWGTGLAASGNTINVNLGAGVTELPNDEVGVHLYAPGGTGALILTQNGTTWSVDTSAALHLLVGAGLTQDAAGLYIPALGVTNAMLTNSTITINGDAGAFAAALGSTIIIDGDAPQGVSTDASVAGTVMITVADATTASKGVASFSASDFAVAAGVVSIALGGVDNNQLANSTINFIGSDASADTVSLGGGLTFIDGGSHVGNGVVKTAVAADTVSYSIREATTGALGIASFSSDHFSVTAGAVSLAASLADLTNVGAGADAAVAGDVLRFVGSEWTAVSTATLAGSINLTDLGDVTTTNVDGHALINTGAGWTNQKIYHVETVGAASATWNVTHGIGQQYCNVTIVDSTDQVIIPNSITFNDATSLTVTFTQAITGKVVVMGIA